MAEVENTSESKPVADGEISSDSITNDNVVDPPLDPVAQSVALVESSVEPSEQTENSAENVKETADPEAGQTEAPISASTTPAIQTKHSSHDEKDGLNKIFVGGITQETSDSDLRAYFGTHGTILDITIMKDRLTGKSRGFGFITFESAAVADKVVAGKHEVNGKAVEAKPAVPRGSNSNSGWRSSTHVEDSSPKATKIFVGGLSPEVEDAQLKEYFSQFGSIVEATVVVDKETSRKRGFGFITFGSYQAVDDILSKKEHSIMDKVVEVKRAFPKGSGSQSMNRSAPPPMNQRGGGGYAPRGYNNHNQGFYPNQDAGYGQGAYGYYGGYDHSNSYQGYGNQGYGGGGHASGYPEQHAAYGHDDGSMHSMYGGQGQQGYMGYDAHQQQMYNGGYGGAYQGYPDASGGYGGQGRDRYDAGAAARYHPYSR